MTTSSTPNHSDKQTYTVGLTGGIASGKSTVSRMFAELGIAVCDADQLSRDAVAPNSAGLEKVVHLFGAQARLPDGSMNRPWLRELIFQNDHKRQQLEAIIHPIVRQGLIDFVQQADSFYVMLEIPLLIEGGLQSLCHRVLVVDVAEATQIERITQRDGGNAAQAQAILDAQISRSERIKHADDVLSNDGDLDNLQKSVVALHNKYLQFACTPAK